MIKLEKKKMTKMKGHDRIVEYWESREKERSNKEGEKTKKERNQRKRNNKITIYIFLNKSEKMRKREGKKQKWGDTMRQDIGKRTERNRTARKGKWNKQSSYH